MLLVLQNGYPFPYPEGLTEDESYALSDAAPGVTLTVPGVVHFEWKYTLTVEFASREAFETAKALTGWKQYGDLILEAIASPEEGYEHPAIIIKDKAYCGFILRIE